MRLCCLLRQRLAGKFGALETYRPDVVTEGTNADDGQPGRELCAAAPHS